MPACQQYLYMYSQRILDNPLMDLHHQPNQKYALLMNIEHTIVNQVYMEYNIVLHYNI